MKALQMFRNTFISSLLLPYQVFLSAKLNSPIFPLLFRLHCFESLPSSYSVSIIIILFVYVTFKKGCIELKTTPQVWSEESELKFIGVIFVPDIILRFMLLNSRLAILFQLLHAPDSRSIYCDYNKASRSFSHVQLWIHTFNILFLCFAYMTVFHVELHLLDWEGWSEGPRVFDLLLSFSGFPLLHSSISSST